MNGFLVLLPLVIVGLSQTDALKWFLSVVVVVLVLLVELLLVVLVLLLIAFKWFPLSEWLLFSMVELLLLTAFGTLSEWLLFSMVELLLLLTAFTLSEWFLSSMVELSELVGQESSSSSSVGLVEVALVLASLGLRRLRVFCINNFPFLLFLIGGV